MFLGRVNKCIDNIYIKQNGAEDDSPERRPVVDTTSSDVVQGSEEPYGSDDESGT